MRELTPEGLRLIDDLARQHGFSSSAVRVMLAAVAAGGGGMAQFDHPEFGGMGQWSQGGMTMIGDMFNNTLKARVDGLCSELADLVARQPSGDRGSGAPTQSQSQSQGGYGGGFVGGGEVSLFVPAGGRFSSGWWPPEFGQPSSTGQQNELRYAVFPAVRRLVIDIGGRTTIYDTLDHAIGGVSQQQGGDASFSFTSQHGLVRLADLPVVGGDVQSRSPHGPAAVSPSAATAPAAEPAPSAPHPVGFAAEPSAAGGSPPTAGSSDEIFAKLERLADLRGKGILTEDEFAAKKAELLARL